MRLFALFFALVLTVNGWATTWYLNKNVVGGSNNGTSPANAWNGLVSFYANYSSVQTGDTVLMMGGDYSNDAVTTVGELALSPSGRTGITFKIDPAATSQAIFASAGIFSGNSCTIDGLIPASGGFKRWTDGTTSPTGQYANDIQWIKTVDTSGRRGGPLALQASTWMRVSNGATLRGIEVDQSAILYGVNDRGQQQHGLGIAGNALNNTVEYMYIHDTVGDGINANYDTTLNLGYTNTTFTNMVFRYNWISRNGDDGITVGSNHSIYGNFLDQGGVPIYYGGHPDSVQVLPKSSYGRIYNNVMANSGQQPFLEKVAGEMYVYQNYLLILRANSAGITTVPGNSKAVVFSSMDTYYPISVTSITRSGTTATVTTATPHGNTTGHPATMSGATGGDAALYNITALVTVTDSTHFTYTMAGTPSANATGTLSTYEGSFGVLMVANNLIYDANSLTAIAGGYGSNGFNTVIFAGNVMYNPSTGGPSTDQYVVESTSIYWDLSGAVWYNYTTGVQSSTPPSPRYVGTMRNVDPGLVSPTTLDFNISSGSSNVVASSTDLSAYFTTDYDGNARPTGVLSWTAGPRQWTGSPLTGALTAPRPTLITYPYLLATVGDTTWARFGGPSSENGVMFMGNGDPVTLTSNIGNLPPGITVTANRGLFAGTPTTAGSYLVTEEIKNGGTTLQTSTFNFAVRANSSTPAVASPLTDSWAVGVAHTYQLLGSNAPTSYGATGLPTGGSINTTTGLITFTSGVAGGTYPVTVSATNGTGTGTATVTYTVTGGSATGGSAMSGKVTLSGKVTIK